MKRQSSESIIASVIERWRAQDAVSRPGVSPEDIAEFERLHQVSLPDDLKNFFQAVDGMEHGRYDEHLIRFWMLSEIAPVVEEVPTVDSVAYSGYFVFADYSLWAHAYAIRLSSEMPNDVVVVAADAPTSAASSFTEFMAKYLENPRSLFPG